MPCPGLYRGENQRREGVCMGGCERYSSPRIGGRKWRVSAATALGEVQEQSGAGKRETVDAVGPSVARRRSAAASGRVCRNRARLGRHAAEVHGRRISLATWYRFRQAAEQARSCLVVLGSAAYAQSSAEVVLECAPHEARGQTVLQGYAFDVQLKRQRAASAMTAMRKPPASTWTAPNSSTTGTKP